MYKNLQNVINSLPFNEVITLLNNYQKETGIDVSKTKSKLITENFQDKLICHGINSVCPHCNSKKIVGYGYNGNIKRFKCKDCGKLFTLFTNTILEKTKYSWDIWVKVLELVLNHTELKNIHHILVDDFGLEDLDYKTVFLWVHKLIHAMAEMPMPKLSGTIQVDETFFRETQKGSRKLVSTLANEKRRPRYGRAPSKFGVMGNEFATVVVATDINGYCVSKLVGLGRLTIDAFAEHFDKYIENPTFICSDKNSVYIDYCKAKGYPLYIKPSHYVNTLKKAGYITPDYSDSVLCKKQELKNKAILKNLYKHGEIDYLHSSRYIDYETFFHIKNSNSLSLARVNQFHGELKTQLVTDRKGVNTKYLADYVGFITYLRNWSISNGHEPSSLKDAENILVDILKGKTVYRTSDIKKKGFNLPKASGQYMSWLKKKTNEVRKVTGNKYFKFDEEDNVISFNKKEFLYSLPKYRLDKLRIKFKLPKAWAKDPVITALLKEETIEQEIFLLINEYKFKQIEDEDNEGIKAREYALKMRA